MFNLDELKCNMDGMKSGLSDIVIFYGTTETKITEKNITKEKYTKRIFGFGCTI